MKVKLPDIKRGNPAYAGEADSVDCCIVGGGPAGVVLALLLVRQGVEVLLLEAQADFDRDFRGDTVHASTLHLLAQLGLLERFLDVAHAVGDDFPTHFPDGSISPRGAGRLPTAQPTYRVPQARLLELLAGEAQRYPSFRLVMGGRVEDLIKCDGVVRGVRYRAPDGMHSVAATLVVGADGRFSKVRQSAGLPLVTSDEAMDVLWLRLPRGTGDPERAAGIYLGPPGHGPMVVADRAEAWQIGYLFPKGSLARLRADGLPALRAAITARAAWLADAVEHLQNWRQTSVLMVQAGRVPRWYRPGLLLIGDAAHVMSPVAGVGINYAIQDAVVAANLLGPRLRQGRVRTVDLASVQRRRELPTRLMQLFQHAMAHRVGTSSEPLHGARWLDRGFDLPPVRAVRERLIAYGGFRPEHVRAIPAEPLRRRAGKSWAAGLVAVAVLLAIACSLAAASVAEPTSTVEPASVSAVTPVPLATPECWVSGDLVGDANPAEVRAAVCGFSVRFQPEG
ncbi:MAG: FAD-dependent oxidoreductase [Chloroflexi bacterium]|nr:FAD-dependent oxidoreductase [Chloroflexota bacterium]